MFSHSEFENLFQPIPAQRKDSSLQRESLSIFYVKLHLVLNINYGTPTVLSQSAFHNHSSRKPQPHQHLMFCNEIEVDIK